MTSSKLKELVKNEKEFAGWITANCQLLGSRVFFAQHERIQSYAKRLGLPASAIIGTSTAPWYEENLMIRARTDRPLPSDIT